MTFPRIGVIGGGQLARMMAPAAEALGVSLSVLAEDASVCATQVIPDAPVGDYRDLDTLREFAKDKDVITFDHEHVPTAHLRALQAEGVVVHPSPDALVHAQDKIVMREAMERLGLPNPRWRAVGSAEELESFGDEIGWPLILKAPRGGYDGKGVWLVQDATAGAEHFNDESPKVLLAEERVPFEGELAVMVARSPMGQTAVWPVVSTVQENGICKEAIAPAPGLDESLATEITADVLNVAGSLGVTGVMAMEMFLVRAEGGEQRYVINELAMRPHNTGHWTQDGSVTSQFEQHLRAVLDLPLGDPAALFPATVMVNVLGGDYPDLYHAYRHVMARDPQVKVHMYGKSVKPGRKVGHVNIVGDDAAELLERARHAADYITGVITE